MSSRLATVLAVAFGFLLVSTPLDAHHGGSMFDMKNSITMKGTVTRFEWVNPHVMIFADVKDNRGNLQKWAVETRGGPNVLTKAGWTKDTLKPGDQVTLMGHQAKNGTSTMRLAKVVLANGQELDLESHSWF